MSAKSTALTVAIAAARIQSLTPAELWAKLDAPSRYMWLRMVDASPLTDIDWEDIPPAPRARLMRLTKGMLDFLHFAGVALVAGHPLR